MKTFDPTRPHKMSVAQNPQILVSASITKVLFFFYMFEPQPYFCVGKQTVRELEMGCTHILVEF